MTAQVTYAARVPLPHRGSNRLRVPLTALADTMFQLLIFFMLASNLTPYSNLLLQSGPSAVGPPGGSGNAGNTAAPAAPPLTTLWTVGPDGLRIGGQDFTLGDIPVLAESLPDGAQVVLVLRDRARVRDVATVLERLRGSGVGTVRIAAGSGG